MTPGALRAASLVGMPIARAALSAVVSASPGFSDIKIEELVLISIAAAGRPATTASWRRVSALALTESLLKRAHLIGSIRPSVTAGAILTMSAWRAITSRIFLPEPPIRIFGCGFWTGLGKL